MKIYVWGTGRLMGKVIGKYLELNDIEAFIDNDLNKIECMGKKVLHPYDVINKQYDAIIVINSFSEDIYVQCKEMGFDMSKIVFLYKNNILYDLNSNYELVKKIFGERYTETIRNRYYVVRDTQASGALCFKEIMNFWQDGYPRDDYVRIRTFEFVVKEIRKRKLKGEVAELGVFRGEFAQYINLAFPEKKIYLFDSFEGFNSNEAIHELKQDNCTQTFIEAYKHTNLSCVIQKMKYIDNIIIKQGYFPSSLDGLEEMFVFVSVDVDFEDSIYEGLRYFYPRLVSGGYIFVHDYNSELHGVENAIERYEKELGINICKVPLSDANGTLVITK